MSVDVIQSNPRQFTIRFFSALAHLAIRRPRTALVIVAIATLVAVPGIPRLKLRTDGQTLVPQHAPEVIYDQTIRDQFGIEDQIVVMIKSDKAEGLFNPATLQLVRDLTGEFAKMPGINPSNVISLATEPGMHLRKGSLIHETLLESPLRTKAELDQLREDLRRIELYTGTLISADRKSTVILIGVPAGSDCVELYRRVQGIIANKQPVAEEITVTGAPVAESLLGTHILEDLGVPKKFLGTSTQARSEQTGMPRTFYGLRLFIARRIGLVPLAVVVMMLVLLLSFRNPLAVLIPLPGVAATMLVVFGLMGWLGVPIYLTIAILPVLLTTVSVTNDIYLFNRYFTLLRERPQSSHLELVRETMDKLVAPVASTSLTAGIGFMSFALSPLVPVRAFGIFTGIGVLFGLCYSLTAIPAMLVLINPAWLLSRRKPGSGNVALADWFSRLGPLVVRRRFWIVALALVTLALLPFGLRRTIVQDSWTDAFDPSSEFRRVTSEVNKNFFGMHLLYVSINAPATLKGDIPASAVTRDGFVLPTSLVKTPALLPGGAITIFAGPGSRTGPETHEALGVWRSHIEMTTRLDGSNILARVAGPDAAGGIRHELTNAGGARFEIALRSHFRPDLIRAIGDFGSFIRKQDHYAVGGVIGAADFLSTTRFMARPNDPQARVLPNDPAEMGLLWGYYGLAVSPQRVRQLVDSNYWASLTTVFLKDANFVDTAKLMTELRNYEHENLTPKGIQIGFAGDVAVSQSLIRGIVTTQLQSLIWSLAGILLVTALLGGSMRWGFYCVLPSLVAVMIKFAVMGWLGIPLGVATSMFAAMTLGIGVNCAIHLLESYTLARTPGTSSAHALNQALRLTGPPALINTASISLGFGVLVLSQVPANARLGILLVLGLVNCFVASLLILPVLLHWFPGRARADRV